METLDSTPTYSKDEVKMETITPEFVPLPNYDYGNKEETLDYNVVLRNKPTIPVVSDYISDTAYGSGWDGVTTIAPSKNAVYDKINSIDSSITTLQNNADSFLLMWA